MATRKSPDSGTKVRNNIHTSFTTGAAFLHLVTTATSSTSATHYHDRNNSDADAVGACGDSSAIMMSSSPPPPPPLPPLADCIRFLFMAAPLTCRAKNDIDEVIQSARNQATFSSERGTKLCLDWRTATFSYKTSALSGWTVLDEGRFEVVPPPVCYVDLPPPQQDPLPVPEKCLKLDDETNLTDAHQQQSKHSESQYRIPLRFTILRMPKEDCPNLVQQQTHQQEQQQHEEGEEESLLGEDDPSDGFVLKCGADDTPPPHQIQANTGPHAAATYLEVNRAYITGCGRCDAELAERCDRWQPPPAQVWRDPALEKLRNADSVLTRPTLHGYPGISWPRHLWTPSPSKRPRGQWWNPSGERTCAEALTAARETVEVESID